MTSTFHELLRGVPAPAARRAGRRAGTDRARRRSSPAPCGAIFLRSAALRLAPLVAILLLAPGCAGRESAAPQERSSGAAADTVLYVARGNEPFWALEVGPGGIEFREPGQPAGVRGDYHPAIRQGDRLVFRTTLGDPARTPVELTLEPGPCTDSMSGRAYPYSAVAHVGGRVLHGCAESRPPAEDTAPSSAATPGDWRVTSHRIPGMSAMSDAEAAAWHGRVARYSATLATFGADTCRAPSYRMSEMRADSLFPIAYHLPAAALGFAPGATVTRIEVLCNAEPWAAPGSMLFRRADGTALTTWDGAFFELRPEPR